MSTCDVATVIEIWVVCPGGSEKGGGATEPNPPIFGATKTIEFLTKEAMYEGVYD